MTSIFCRSMGPPKREAFSKQNKGHMGSRCIQRSLQKETSNLKELYRHSQTFFFRTSMVCPCCCCLFFSREPKASLQQRFLGLPFSGKTLTSWRRSRPYLATTRTVGGFAPMLFLQHIFKKAWLRKIGKLFFGSVNDHRRPSPSVC